MFGKIVLKSLNKTMFFFVNKLIVNVVLHL